MKKEERKVNLQTCFYCDVKEDVAICPKDGQECICWARYLEEDYNELCHENNSL